MTRQKTKMTALRVSVDVATFLEAAAARSKTDISAVLEATLATRKITMYPEAAELTAKLKPEAIQVLEELDRLLRTANPGSQPVFRTGFIGYRRFDPRQPSGVTASRSQIYVSLVPRQFFVRVVLPLDARDYRHVKGITDLTGKGHHGVGTAAISVHTPTQAKTVLSGFEDWLGPVATVR
jgi:hypothetical protein